MRDRQSERAGKRVEREPREGDEKGKNERAVKKVKGQKRRKGERRKKERKTDKYEKKEKRWYSIKRGKGRWKG